MELSSSPGNALFSPRLYIFSEPRTLARQTTAEEEGAVRFKYSVEQIPQRLRRDGNMAFDVLI